MSEGYGVDILAFGAHPDDVELCCGGLLARAADAGRRTAIVDLTAGERASRGTVAERAAEAAEAARLLGVAVRENLGLPDAWLNPWAGYDAATSDERTRGAHVAAVVEVLRRLRPELVVAPWERERHPDHEACSALVTKAVFYAGVARFETAPARPRFTPRQVLYYPMRVPCAPTFVVDTSGAEPRKLAAVAAHVSQVGPPAGSAAGAGVAAVARFAPGTGAAVGADGTPPIAAPPTLIGSGRTLEWLDARDRWYGSMIGATHGEPYVTRSVLGLVDPLDHFRRNDVGPALVWAEVPR